MFSTNQLQGILLSIAKPEVHISRSDSIQIGYRVRMRINIRGNLDFLLSIQRTFLQKGIECKVKEQEHKSRPRPILTISGKDNINKTIVLVPHHLPDAKGDWFNFRKIAIIVDKGEHHTLEGLDKIFKIKGEI